MTASTSSPCSEALSELPTPALIVDLDKLESNLERMQARAGDLSVRLRPHVKTHKCVEIAQLQLEAGAVGIAVSTLYEAQVFAGAGFEDITWAFPLILSRVGQAARLSRRIRLGVTVDSPQAVAALTASGERFHVWMKVDCGYHRAGVDPVSGAPLRLAADIEAGGHELVGLLSHSGNAYDERTLAGRAAVAEAERERITTLAGRLRAAGFEVPELSVGSTPGMTAVAHLAGVTEMRPGNYAYFDRTQVGLGSCAVADCALTVLASVVSCQADHCVIDAGALALSKDSGPADSVMGGVFVDATSGELDEELVVTSLSQEHGKLNAPLPVGTRVRVLPNHSCLAAACFDQMVGVRGEEVVASWRVWNGR